VHVDDLVRDAAQEQGPPLAADIRGSSGEPSRQFALQRHAVLPHTFGHVVVGRIGTRLIRAIVRVVREVGDERRLFTGNAPPLMVDATRSLSIGWI
jgi:hypothetical protein